MNVFNFPIKRQRLSGFSQWAVACVDRGKASPELSGGWSPCLALPPPQPHLSRCSLPLLLRAGHQATVSGWPGSTLWFSVGLAGDGSHLANHLLSAKQDGCSLLGCLTFQKHVTGYNVATVGDGDGKSSCKQPAVGWSPSWPLIRSAELLEPMYSEKFQDSGRVQGPLVHCPLGLGLLSEERKDDQ